MGLGFEAGSSNSFKGTADSKVDELFQTKISATIEQRYRNGNYLIKGSKAMLINGQKQVMQISGLIRPYDISPNNSIESAQMANLRILFSQEGDEIENIQKPWGSQALESIAPF